ncbi:MAG: hypothetical protein IT239_05970 [Bacteroidia bacterium]|nr:hypothetical protein [Bacteroidia bacterium]
MKLESLKSNRFGHFNLIENSMLAKLKGGVACTKEQDRATVEYSGCCSQADAWSGDKYSLIGGVKCLPDSICPPKNP